MIHAKARGGINKNHNDNWSLVPRVAEDLSQIWTHQMALLKGDFSLNHPSWAQHKSGREVVEELKEADQTEEEDLLGHIPERTRRPPPVGIGESSQRPVRL